jgi:hypothetical protein
MLTLTDIRAHLRHAVAQDLDLPIHVRAFCAWMTRDRAALARAVAESISFTGQMRHPEHIAALGYGARARQLVSADAPLLDAEIKRLSGRAFFAQGRPLRFEIDGIALLGVAMGVAAGADTALTTWCLGLLGRSATEVAADPWQLGLVRAALHALGPTDLRITPTDLAAACAAKGLYGNLHPPDREDAWRITVGLLPHQEGPPRDAVRLAIFEHEFSRLAQIALSTPTRRDLLALLQAVGRGMKRWTFEHTKRTANSEIARWDIENEYHVQNLLWAVLAPVFPYLEDEENLPSIGHKKPRADLGIPSLRTIIEVKFLRGRGQRALADITEEIAADASLYLSRTADYDNIIAFVWDDAAQTEQHHELRQGIETINGVTAAVILPRPSSMQKPA